MKNVFSFDVGLYLSFAAQVIHTDPIADLYEDIAAEEKARATYQWLIDITDDEPTERQLQEILDAYRDTVE